MKTTLAILALNEIEGMQVVVPQIRRDWIDEIIVVDGGSTDGTIEWCEAHGLRVLRQRGRGYGAGMREVMEIANGDVVVEFMARRQLRPVGDSPAGRQDRRRLRPGRRLPVHRWRRQLRRHDDHAVRQLVLHQAGQRAVPRLLQRRHDGVSSVPHRRVQDDGDGRRRPDVSRRRDRSSSPSTATGSAKLAPTSPSGSAASVRHITSTPAWSC